MWQPAMFQIQFIEYDAQFIHMRVESLLSKESFYLTFIYAFNGIQERIPLWNKLGRIANKIRGPWAMGGDFNCVLAHNERCGGNTTQAEIDDFRSCVTDCGMLDIQAIRSWYTWNNKQRPEDRTYGRLDKFMVNKDWTNCYSEYYAHFLPEEKFTQIMQDTWEVAVDGTIMYQVARKLKALKSGLKQFNKERFSDIDNATNFLQLQVSKLQEELGVNPTDLDRMEEEFQATQK
ncbi:uncharacterized protein LOC141641069 [Silene latifolia]|uniref:uncharacterized protein LOC141641069 n=1 Tax=Silene latifolia TaxID=37657 RepID=UPI003D77AE23